MALQAFSLRRAQQTTGADPKLMEITPKNWRRYPPPIQSPRPVYVPTVGYTGGLQNEGAYSGNNGESGTISSTNDWNPKTQLDKTTAGNLTPGTTMAQDVAAPRGPIQPRQPYPTAASPAVVAPVVGSIAPSTGAAAALPLMVTITGTGFTPYSTVYTGGSRTPELKAQYISPTQMKVPIWAASPGTVSVAVKDHGTMSNTNINFTVT